MSFIYLFFIILILGRGILYTESAMILNDTKNNMVYELKNFANITAEGDNYDPIFCLNIQFNLSEKSVSTLLFFRIVF